MSESLTDFLLARIAEDEALHQEVIEWTGPDRVFEVYLERREANETRTKWLDAYNPRRLLIDCQAKRTAVEGYLGDDHVVMGATVKAMAAAYADHPDYREEWRP